ncbi:hypothetical protein AB0J90_28500 [Micromonospora sp. NPDC049523]|uniref:hypothetical protein n=1 Tax=Micromonospora sp. NPDC049523 TaxID=3155921 RepID=UPI00343BE962
MNDESVLRRRVNVLLRAYPRRYRAERGEEIAATMLDVAAPGQTWPSVREVGGVLLGAARLRSRSADLTLPTLIRHALQLAVVGVTVPLVVFHHPYEIFPHLPFRGQLIAWAVPYALLVGGLVAAAVGAYGTGLALLGGTYALQHLSGGLAVDGVPIGPYWMDYYYLPGVLLGVLLLWRLADRLRPHVTVVQPGRLHRAPPFSVVTVVLITAVVPILNETLLPLPLDGLWWQYELHNFAPYLMLLLFVGIDPRIPLAGAPLAILDNSRLFHTVFGTDIYPQREVLKAALVLGGALAAGVVLAAASVLARWRLSRH